MIYASLAALLLTFAALVVEGNRPYDEVHSLTMFALFGAAVVFGVQVVHAL